MRKNHRYLWIITEHPDTAVAAHGIGNPVEICKHCFTIRECIGTVGLYQRIRSYVRPDGIRFTGQAPPCGQSINTQKGEITYVWN